MSEAITDPAELLQVLQLPLDLLPAAIAAAALFPLRVPRPYLQRIRPGDRNDPLLLQVLPLQQEQNHHPEWVDDPVGDLDAERVPGLLHKYRGRVLLMTTGACAVHCRYCFRRHYPYSGKALGHSAQRTAIDTIRSDPSITEVILSGGDPLSLSDQRLAALAKELQDIPHLQRLRIHTRQPIVLPQRVDPQLTDWISTCRFPVVVVLHCNHPHELDQPVLDAITRLSNAGARLLNQSVLLRGINDDADTLSQLSEQLFAAGVLPYYLHLMDKVSGAQHFDVSRDHALALHQRLRDRLPGYLLPRLVNEQAGQAAKSAVYNCQEPVRELRP
jgi:EF-P beta-lysylation protein EpmB